MAIEVSLVYQQLTKLRRKCSGSSFKMGLLNPPNHSFSLTN
jgi:hypothetical protein